MQSSTNILNSIKNTVIKLNQINVGDLAGRAVILIQANSIPVAIAAIVIVAALIFVAYKYLYVTEVVPHSPKIEIFFEVKPDDVKNVISTKSKKVKKVVQNLDLGVQTQPERKTDQPKTDYPNNVKTKIEEPTNLLSSSSLGNSLIASGFFSNNTTQSTLQVLRESFIAKEISADDLYKSISSLGLNKNSALEIGLASTAEQLSDPLGFFSKEFTDRVTLQLNSISEVISKIQKNPCHIANAGFTFLSGLASVLTGNVTGIVPFCTGIKDLYNIYQMESNSNLEVIFKNIDSDFKVIGKLGKQSKQALFGIKEQIENTKLKISNIEIVFEKINQIIKDGDESLKIYESEINQLKNDVEYYTTSSMDNFKKSQEFALMAEADFDKCLLNIQKLAKGETLNENETDKIKGLMVLASGLGSIFTRGMMNFRGSQNAINLGLDDLNELKIINFQLDCKEGLLIELSKAINEKISELTKNKNLEEANEHLENANGLLNDALRIRLAEDETIKGLKDNIDKVHEEVSSWVDRNMLLGACGAVIGAPFGPVTAGVLAIACPKAVNAATEIFTPKTDLKTSFADPENVGDVSMGFYTESTGCFYLFKGASKTAGEVKIHTVTEIKIYKFNLNEDHFGLNFDQITADLKDLSLEEQSKTKDILIELLEHQVTK